MSGRIRAATLSDAAQVAEIYGHYVRESAITFEIEVPSVEEMRTRIEETMRLFPYLVYELDEKILGYAYAGRYRTRAAYDWTLESTVYVRAGSHGLGIGGKLYADLLPRLKVQGAVNVIAGITLPNPGSVGIHEHFGFKPAGCIKDAGYKLNQWWDVGFWQLQLQLPEMPKPLILIS